MIGKEKTSRVKRAIRAHLRDMIAVAALVAIGVGVGAYILANQRLRFPLHRGEAVAVWVELPNAQGVTPGQGQTVRVSGMRVGDIGKVELEDGRARVRMDLEPEYDDLVRRDATRAAAPAHRPQGHVPRARPGHAHRAGGWAATASIPIDNTRARRERRRDPVRARHRHARLPASC